MAADDVRALLDEALAAHQTTRGMRVSMGWTCACGWWSPDQSPPLILAHQADALLPVVDRIAREAAGKALRDAAVWALENWNEAHAWLERRADAAERGQA